MLSTAFDARANDGSRDLLPTDCSLDNFRFVLDEGGFDDVPAQLAARRARHRRWSAGCWRCSPRWRWPGSSFRFRTSVLVMVLVVQMVPLEALVIPLFIQAKIAEHARQPHRAGRRVRRVLAAVRDLDAARLRRGGARSRSRRRRTSTAPRGGGCSGRSCFPLVAPGLVATSVFSFITAWNEFVFAITFLNDDRQVHRRRRAAAVLHPVRHRLGLRDGRVDADHGAGDAVLRDRAASAQRRASSPGR